MKNINIFFIASFLVMLIIQPLNAAQKEDDPSVNYFKAFKVQLPILMVQAVRQNNIGQVRDIFARGLDVDKFNWKIFGVEHPYLEAMDRGFVTIAYEVTKHSNKMRKKALQGAKLIKAIKSGDYSEAKKALKAGAYSNVCDLDGKPALLIAQLRGHKDIKDLLESYYAKIGANLMNRLWKEASADKNAEEMTALFHLKKRYETIIEKDTEAFLAFMKNYGILPNSEFDESREGLLSAILSPTFMSALLKHGTNKEALFYMCIALDYDVSKFLIKGVIRGDHEYVEEYLNEEADKLSTAEVQDAIDISLILNDPKMTKALSYAMDLEAFEAYISEKISMEKIANTWSLLDYINGRYYCNEIDYTLQLKHGAKMYLEHQG